MKYTYGHERGKAGRPARTYIQQLCADTVLKTYRKRWTIETGGGRGSGISVLMVRHDDDDINNITMCKHKIKIKLKFGIREQCLKLKLN